MFTFSLVCSSESPPWASTIQLQLNFISTPSQVFNYKLEATTVCCPKNYFSPLEHHYTWHLLMQKHRACSLSSRCCLKTFHPSKILTQTLLPFSSFYLFPFQLNVLGCFWVFFGVIQHVFFKYWNWLICKQSSVGNTWPMVGSSLG